MQTRNSRNVANSRHRRKELLVYLMGGKCSRCGYDRCIKALEFHHIDKSTKSFTISYAIHSLEDDINEVKKCSLLCANCHREVEDSGELTFNTFNEEVFQEYMNEVKETQQIAQNKKICPKCGKPKSSEADLCSACARLNSRKVQNRPDRQELKNMIRSTPFTKIAEYYGVSDNAVRRWCDSYLLPRKRKDIDNISDKDWENI